MKCELCGRNDANYNTEIEGTVMNVCQECSRFGKVKNRSNVKIVIQEAKKKPEIKEPTYVFLPGYGSILKRAREKLGLKQEELAKRLNERESVLHQIESEHFKPSVEMAKKLQRELHIKIIEELTDAEASDNPAPQIPRGTGALTLADMMAMKKK